MGSTAKRTDPDLWERVKREVTDGDKGGAVGQWSARKAQMAVQAYKRRGGGYEGAKRPDNDLRQWTNEDWGTASGRRSRDTGERMLPRQAREHLSPDQYRRSSDAKRRDTKAGRQHSPQPKDIARRTAPHHHSAKRGNDPEATVPTLAALRAEARRRGIPGRSKMSREELRHAIGG